MTTASAQAVLNRVEADEAFGERVKDAGGPEASLALLRAEGFEVTKEELRDAVLDRYGDALTPEQVEAISGGMSEDEAFQVGVGIGAGTVGVATLGALAAAVVL